MTSWKLENWSATDQIVRKLLQWGTAGLRLLPAELAHEIGMRSLAGHWLDPLLNRSLRPPLSGLKTKIPGIGDLAHPIGLAAGFDKDCRTPESFIKLGFSFIEIGTVTPRPQPGNPKPRMFRYPEQMALVNRMGFNSAGASVVSERLRRRNWQHERAPLGVNVGKNKTTNEDRAIDDYLRCLQAFQGLGRYYVINISSPNTPGLRQLASVEFLELLASQLGQQTNEVWVKLDPDMEGGRFRKIVENTAKLGFQGLILANTHRVEWPEAGGMSGHPLAIRSTKCLEWAHEVHQGELPVIASGGILGGLDVFERIARGALAVQIYTALVYRGPWAVVELLVELQAAMKQRGFSTLEEVRGSYYLEN